MIDVNRDPGAEKRAEIMKRINQALPGTATIVPGKALALTEDNQVVESDHPDAAFVLVGEGGSLPADLAKELGIKAGKPKPEPEPAQPGGVVMSDQDGNVISSSVPTEPEPIAEEAPTEPEPAPAETA